MAAIVARLTRRRRNKDHYKEYETSKVNYGVRNGKRDQDFYSSACTSCPRLRTHFSR